MSSNNIQVNLLRPAKAEQALNKSLLKDSKSNNIIEPDKAGINEQQHFFTADTRAKILLTDLSVDLEKKSREELQKVFDVYYKKLGKQKKLDLRRSSGKAIKKLTVPVQKQESLPLPSENLENNVENDVQRPFSPITATDSIAKSPSLRGGFTLVQSPIYGPLKKVETDPLTTEFRYIFKKYYKELPLYQPRVPKERPIPSIDPATYSTDENAIKDILKIRVSKFNYKDAPKQKIHTVSKNFDESTDNISTKVTAAGLDDRCYDIVSEDVVKRLVDILREFQSANSKSNIAENSPIVAPIGTVNVPTISRPVSAMNRNISSNISPLNSNSIAGNIAGIETLFSKGKHLPRSSTGKVGSHFIEFNSFDGSSSGKLAPLHSAHSRPKSSDNRKAVVQRAILTKTDPAKTWTIPEEYK